MYIKFGNLIKEIAYSVNKHFISFQWRTAHKMNHPFFLARTRMNRVNQAPYDNIIRTIRNNISTFDSILQKKKRIF